MNSPIGLLLALAVALGLAAGVGTGLTPQLRLTRPAASRSGQLAPCPLPLRVARR